MDDKKPKINKREWFTKTIEKNLAIAIQRQGGYADMIDLPKLLNTDEVTAKMAAQILVHNGNAAFLPNGKIKLSDDLQIMMKTDGF